MINKEDKKAMNKIIYICGSGMAAFFVAIMLYGIFFLEEPKPKKVAKPEESTYMWPQPPGSMRTKDTLEKEQLIYELSHDRRKVAQR